MNPKRFKPTLSASSFKEEKNTLHLIEVSIPTLRGPEQDKPWVGVLRELTRVGYFN